MQVLGIGDVIGKPGRDVLRARCPALVARARHRRGGRQRRELGGRPRHHAPRPPTICSRSARTCSPAATTPGSTASTPATSTSSERALRPYNYPAGAPGRGLGVVRAARRARVRGRQPDRRAHSWSRSRTRFTPPIARSTRSAARAASILVDMHAEASSEKRAHGLAPRRARERGLGHAHARADRRRGDPAARHRATSTDVGMTGPYASVIGLEPQWAR